VTAVVVVRDITVLPYDVLRRIALGGGCVGQASIA
jgi:hypothetical protein